MIGHIRRWNSSLDDRIHPRALALLRLAAAPLVIIHLLPSLSETSNPHYTLPYASWYPTAPPDVRRLILWLTVVSAVAVSVGLLTRVAAWVTVGGVGWNLFLSQTYFHHNRAFLLILLIGIAVLPTGAVLSLDHRLGTPAFLSVGNGRRLALTALRCEIALVYLASGFSKLVDPDWWGGIVTLIRVERHVGNIAGRIPGWAVELLTSPGFHRWAAKTIVLAELFIGVGLLWRRTRLGAVWVAVWFHLAIEATANVQVFSLAAIAALAIWVTPGPPDRIVALGADVRPTTRRAIRLLDWTGRFRAATHLGTGWEVVDRDGSIRRGRAALWFVLSRLPLTFLIAAPALLATGRRAYAERVGASDSDVEVPA